MSCIPSNEAFLRHFVRRYIEKYPDMTLILMFNELISTSGITTSTASTAIVHKHQGHLLTILYNKNSRSS